MVSRKLVVALLVALAAAMDPAAAQRRYAPGASDTEIKIGNTMPYSGPASAYGMVGKTEAAYFNKINAEGGINGRKVAFISYDDAYSPPKTVEQARRLVESDEVLLIFQSLGTAPNTAIQKYMNAKKVPQLFVATGATKWNDPKHFPWTMGFQPSYQHEGHIYAKYLLQNHRNGRIGASGSCIRTTITERTISRASRTVSTERCRSSPNFLMRSPTPRWIPRSSI